jgi:hypothetical protein
MEIVKQNPVSELAYGFNLKKAKALCSLEGADVLFRHILNNRESVLRLIKEGNQVCATRSL